MSASSSSTLQQESSPGVREGDARLTALEIDASCRAPLLLLFLSSLGWLTVGLLFALLSSIKLHSPGFLGDSACLTLGRIRPAAMNAILYGFASQAALGISLWLLCRLGATRLCCQAPVMLSTLFWNLGVALGFFGILAGGSTGFEWLEMPRYASPILFTAYSVIGLCALITFHYRRERSLYVSQWYLVAALFWFPWLYSAANLLLVFQPVRGVMQALVSAWFTNNLLELWITPVGLGIIFYFIPKLTGRPLYSSHLAAFGFWTLAIFANWKGLAPLVGGPLPAWMISSSLAANLIMIVPLLAVGLNWAGTLSGQTQSLKQDVVMRFVRFAALSYLLSGALRILTGLSPVSAVTQFTYLPVGVTWLALVGFFGMAAFAGIYYIVPRITRLEWPSTKKIQLHYLCSAGGIALLVISLGIAGVIQGLKLNLGSGDFITVTKSIVPLIGLSTLGLMLLLVGQLIFLAHFIGLIRLYSAVWRKSILDLLGMTAASPVGGKA